MLMWIELVWYTISEYRDGKTKMELGGGLEADLFKMNRLRLAGAWSQPRYYDRKPQVDYLDSIAVSEVWMEGKGRSGLCCLKLNIDGERKGYDR